jgi:colicin import membrane protein
MKKLFLMCFLFAFVVNISAQEKLTDQMKKAKASSEKAVKEQVPLKKDGTPDKRYKTASKVPLKKDGTPDKRFKSNNASETGQERSAAGKAKAAANKSEAKAKNEVKERVSNEKAPPKIKDKVTGTYKGKKVYTGPRGGKYYINSNGNKTYISEDK